METLEIKINKLENKIYQNGLVCADKHKHIVLLRSKYNTLSANKMATKLLKFKHTFYDQGEKAGKVLAWRIKTRQAERANTYIEKWL